MISYDDCEVIMIIVQAPTWIPTFIDEEATCLRLECIWLRICHEGSRADYAACRFCFRRWFRDAFRGIEFAI